MKIDRNMTREDLQQKIFMDYKALQAQAMALRILGLKIGVTIGSFDMLHIGHSRYLLKARSFCDILVVGVDSDAAIKRYKGPKRPVISEAERREMLAYLGFVDFVTTVDDVDEKGKWQYGLVRMIKPDIFVAVEDSYPDDQRREIERHAGELIVLPRQAEGTSSTDIFHKIVKERTQRSR